MSKWPPAHARTFGNSWVQAHPPRVIPLGSRHKALHDWYRPQGVQVSARIQHAVWKRQEITGTFRTNGTGGRPVHSRADRPAFRVHHRYIRRSGYLTSSPVTARPMIIRWISEVPSKMVKIFAGKAESSVSPVTILTCGNVDSRGFR